MKPTRPREGWDVAGESSGRSPLHASAGMSDNASRANFGRSPSIFARFASRRRQIGANFIRLGKWENFFRSRHAATSVERREREYFFLDVIAGVFEQVTVLHAARANGFAGPAAEAGVYMFDSCRTERQASVLHRPHQIDPSTRRIVLVSGFQIGRARGQAKPTMNTGQRFIVVQKAFLRRYSIHNGKSAKTRFGSKRLLNAAKKLDGQLALARVSFHPGNKQSRCQRGPQIAPGQAFRFFR